MVAASKTGSVDVPVGPFGALQKVATHGPPAAGPLMRWVLSRRWPQARGTRADDVIQDVALRLLEAAPDILAALKRRSPQLQGPDADRRLSAYVGAMIRHRHSDIERRARADVLLEPWHAVVPSTPESRVDLDAAMDTLRRARSLLASRRPRLSATLDEVERLASGRAALPALVAAERRAGEPSRVVADRIYKRHARARQGLIRVLRDMVREGIAAHAHATAAGELASAWLRRRRVEATRS